MTPSLEGWPTKAKEAPFPHQVGLALLDTNPVFQCLGRNSGFILVSFFIPLVKSLTDVAYLFGEIVVSLLKYQKCQLICFIFLMKRWKYCGIQFWNENLHDTYIILFLLIPIKIFVFQYVFQWIGEIEVSREHWNYSEEKPENLKMFKSHCWYNYNGKEKSYFLVKLRLTVLNLIHLCVCFINLIQNSFFGIKIPKKKQ